MKKAAAALLAAGMVVSSLVACSGSDNNGTTPAAGDSAGTSGNESTVQGSSEAASSGDVENIVFTFLTTKTAPDGIQMVEDEINKIIEPKIGVHVDFETFGQAQYVQNLGLMMSGGEQVDVVSFLGTFSQMIAKNQLMDITEYMDTVASETKEVVGKDFLKATSVDGRVYAIPTLNGKAAVPNIVIRSDLVEELGLDLGELKQATNWDEYFENMDVLSGWFEKIHEAHPEMVCLVPGAGNSLWTGFPFIDNLTDNYGVLKNDGSTEVINFFETDEFKKLCEYTYDWYEKGYVLQDAATTQEAPNTFIQSGRTAGYFITGEEGQAEQITTATGVPVEAVKLSTPYLTTGAINGIGFGVSSTSEHPEAAMKFINELYTNADIINLLDWGVEGVHYEVQDDGTVDFPEGVTADNTSYGLNMDWFFGNQFLSYVWGKGRDTTIYERLDANNKSAEFSVANGFTYDSTTVRSAITAVENVKSEYFPGLTTGTLAPSEIENFNAALESAGLNDIIQAKQEQLDAWMEKNQ